MAILAIVSTVPVPFHRFLTLVRPLSRAMENVQRLTAGLEEAFDRIEESILPSIALVLDTLLDASENLDKIDPKALAAELQILAAELEGLTQMVERNSPKHLEPGEYRIA